MTNEMTEELPDNSHSFKHTHTHKYACTRAHNWSGWWVYKKKTTRLRAVQHPMATFPFKREVHIPGRGMTWFGKASGEQKSWWLGPNHQGKVSERQSGEMSVVNTRKEGTHWPFTPVARQTGRPLDILLRASSSKTSQRVWSPGCAPSPWYWAFVPNLSQAFQKRHP